MSPWVSASKAAATTRGLLSANGDGFAAWQAHDGTRNNLWASRYCAETAVWARPVNIEAINTHIDDFDLTVYASGNAVVAWHEVPSVAPWINSGVVRSARFDAGSSAWATPVLLNTDAINRFDGATGAWAAAVLAETQPGTAIGPRASARGGQVLLQPLD